MVCSPHVTSGYWDASVPVFIWQANRRGNNIFLGEEWGSTGSRSGSGTPFDSKWMSQPVGSTSWLDGELAARSDLTLNGQPINRLIGSIYIIAAFPTNLMFDDMPVSLS